MVQLHVLNIWLYQNAEHGLFSALELRTPWKEPIEYFFFEKFNIWISVNKCPIVLVSMDLWIWTHKQTLRYNIFGVLALFFYSILNYHPVLDNDIELFYLFLFRVISQRKVT